MENLKFNEPQFELQCTNLAEDALRIVSFEGSEQISGLYEYRFQLLSEDPSLNPRDILNCNATFTLHRGDDEPQKINGIISNFKQLGRTPDYVSYQAILVPRLWRLLLNKQSKVFQNLNIEELITQVLKDAGFASSDFEFNLEKTYPPLEFVVQYQETDLNFIQRRLEHFGIFYFIDQRKGNDVIVFCDVNDKVLPVEIAEEIDFNPNKDPLSVQETITELVHDESVVTGQVQLKDYNYEFPSKQLLVESKLDKKAPGTQYSYGDHFKNENEGDILARIRNEEIVCQSSIFTGKGDCRLFRAGYKFQLGKHYREDWNSEFILTKVISRGTQRGLFGILQPSKKVEPTYENIFEAIPQNIAFRPPRIALQPKIFGVMNAKVDAAGKGEHAEIDQQGRYKVILPFDLSGKKDGQASHFIRMIQPYAGPDYGFHFPLHKGTEVLLTYIDGNPDRPVISGAVPNPETISPVTNQNQTKSVIRDNFGNEIIMDATPGDEHISLFSPHHNSGLQLGRSLRKWTRSNESEAVYGNKLEATFGSKGEAVAGNSLDARVGFLWNLSWGLEFESTWGGKYIHNNSYEIKSNREPVIQTSLKDILSSSRQDHIVAAGDQVCIVGGSLSKRSVVKTLGLPLVKKYGRPRNNPNFPADFFKTKRDNRSIVNIFPEKISMSVGAKNSTRNLDEYGGIQPGKLNKNLYEKTPRTGKILAILFPSLAATALSSLGGEYWWAGPERDDYQWITGTASLTSMAVMSFIAFLVLRNEIKDSKIEPVAHENPDASISLGEKENVGKGIFLETRGNRARAVNINNQETSQINMKKDGTIEVVSRSTTDQSKTIDLIAKKGNGMPVSQVTLQNTDITLKSGTTKIVIKKDGDIELKAEGHNVEITANECKLGARKMILDGDNIQIARHGDTDIGGAISVGGG